MRLPARHALISALVISWAGLCPQAISQTKSDKGTVSGKVTIKGKPAAGIVVGMRLNRPQQNSQTYRATTSQDGTYRITNIAGGSYEVAPVVPAFIIADAAYPRGQTVIVTEAESTEGIDFDLLKGGVITGRIVDTGGNPLIDERVSLQPVTQPNQQNVYFPIPDVVTDDRGIYRMYGIRPGRYKVFVGQGEGGGGYRGPGRGVPLVQTFYPDVTDANKASIVDVDEGGELTKIDISVGPAPQAYSVSGRIVESESGKPVPNVPIGINKVVVANGTEQGGYGGAEGVSDAQGEFRLLNVRPGKYQLGAYLSGETNVRLDRTVTFDVVDQDVTGLVIKTTKGATVSGMIVFEGNKPPSMDAVFRNLYITVYTRNENDPGTSSGRSTQVRADGTFQVGGVAPGLANLGVENGRGIYMVRVDRDGVPQPNGIQIQGTESISGISLVVTYNTGTIRGVIKYLNGTPPPGARVMAYVSKPGTTTIFGNSESDARGHFLIQGLAAGDYQLNVQVYSQESNKRPPSAKQMVTVTDGAATEVTITLDLAANP
jgi:hypothetical protein